METVGQLLCGKCTLDGAAKSTLEQLSRSIAAFSRRVVTYSNSEFSEETLAFGPFCARVLLENSCAALVGRLDAFRMLYLSEFQAQPDYEVGKRAKSAFSWLGDVMPEDSTRSGNLWSIDQDVSKISRALFSRHLDHVYWRPAAGAMLDFIATKPPSTDLAEIRDIDVDTFTNETRGRSAQLYSTLSKAVHWEFFSGVRVYDEATVKSAIRDTYLLVGRLGLMSHFVPTAFASLAPEEAIEAYVIFRRELP